MDYELIDYPSVFWYRFKQTILKPDFFDDDVVRFYMKHYWLWCLRMRRIRCLLGFHKWIDCGKDISAYCDRCPMERDSEGNTQLCDIGKG